MRLAAAGITDDDVCRMVVCRQFGFVEGNGLDADGIAEISLRQAGALSLVHYDPSPQVRHAKRGRAVFAVGRSDLRKQRFVPRDGERLTVGRFRSVRRKGKARHVNGPRIGRQEVVEREGRRHVRVRLITAGGQGRSDWRIYRMGVGGHLCLVQGHLFHAHRRSQCPRRQARAAAEVHRRTSPQIRQIEHLLSVSTVDRAEQGKQRSVRTDLENLSVRELPAARREVAREHRDLTDEWFEDGKRQIRLMRGIYAFGRNQVIDSQARLVVLVTLSAPCRIRGEYSPRAHRRHDRNKQGDCRGKHQCNAFCIHQVDVSR